MKLKDAVEDRIFVQRSAEPMRRMSRAFQFLCVVCAFASPVVAFAEVKPMAPPADVKPMWQWVAAIGIFILCGAILFKNAKRSHQD